MKPSTFILIFIYVSISIYILSILTSKSEGFVQRRSCPNILVKKDDKLLLHFRDGKKPIEFNNLDEYTDFIDWQRSENIRCPILYLQPILDAQGKKSYNVSDNPYNTDIHPITLLENKDIPKAFDPVAFSSGFFSVLDNMFISKDVESSNPIDPHWGGQQTTNDAIQSGKYEGSYVYKTNPDSLQSKSLLL